ncbi:MAG: hypothetical protein COA78_27175, partial [Blastopirellula sp.]
MPSTSKQNTAKQNTAELERELSLAKSISDNSPINILVADLDLVITYANPSSFKTLRTLEEHLPIQVDDLIGTNIDIFHTNPEMQRNLLKNDRNLPHRAIIKVADQSLDLLVSATYNADGDYTGPMVTWEVVTEKLALEKAAAEKTALVENAPINIMLANLDLDIIYANPASIDTLRTLEEHLPCKLDEIVGQNVDIFHKDPSYQRNILGNARNLPVQSIIDFADQKLDLLVSPTYDNDGNYAGPMVTWSVVTEKLEMERSAAEKTALVENAPINIMLANLDL